MSINLNSYRAMLGIERSSERLPVGSQANSDLSYRSASQQYRSEQLNQIEATWLNPAIPWKVFITMNVRTAKGAQAPEIVEDVITVMLKMASYRYRQIMSAAYAVEPFPEGKDVHAHVAVGSEAAITVEWFKAYLNRFDDIRHDVLKYSAPAILAYVLKTASTKLINCDIYLKPATTSRERRRVRRTQAERMTGPLYRPANHARL